MLIVRTKKRHIPVPLVSALLVLALYGCGSTGSAGGSVSPATQAGAGDAASAAVNAEETRTDAAKAESERTSAETTSDRGEEQEMIIRVTDGTNTILYKLNDTPPAKSLYDMLPIETEVQNYGNNEKIFYPEETVETAGGVEGGGTAGGLALFSPWGNVVMFYDDFGAYNGLYLLGEAIEGTDQIRNLSGTIRVETY
ncbi:MAG: hypothetical protein IJQ12_04865 [Lachnospiraceae bacterium]|nr:hypothetical protein [Lachnospiraceae bacterium]